MKLLHALYLFVSVFAVGQNLEASSWGQKNPSKTTAVAADQTAPAMPGSMIPVKSPMHSLSSTANANETSSQSIVEIISNDPSFGTLAKAIKAADLIDALSEEGPYTFFAPNDAAFAKLSPGALSDLLKPESKDKLVAILTYHIVPEQKLTSDQLKTAKLKTLQGKPLNLQVKDQNISVNNAKVVKSDISASNGVIHAVDTVLIP